VPPYKFFLTAGEEIEAPLLQNKMMQQQRQDKFLSGARWGVFFHRRKKFCPSAEEKDLPQKM
jgi:hypothetical protein